MGLFNMRACIAVMVLVALCVWSPLAVGQTLGRSRPAKPIANTSGFVTGAEASIVLNRVRDIAHRVVLKKPSGAPSVAIKSAVCSRRELVVVLYDWFKLFEPQFKVTPIPAQYETNQLSIPASDSARPKLERLVAWGFVGRVDPLATGSGAGLTVVEFGEAVGYFLCRLSDLTHTPSTKFSPALMGPDN